MHECTPAGSGADPPGTAAGGQASGQCAHGAALGTGDLIRDLRSVLGWSQSRLAAELCSVSGHVTVTRETVSRWESGKRTPGPFWLRHLATALQVPITVLEEAARMERRTFLTDVAAASVAPLVASDLLAHGFAAALAGRPAQDAWQAKLAAYGRDYMTMGAADIRQRLAGDLVVLQQQVASPAMWAVAARLMTLYAKTFPGSDGAKASSWYRMAAAAADRSGDQESRIWVRGRAAIALGYEGAALPVAALFAGTALAISDQPSAGRLNALMGQAHAAALQGNRPAARRLLTDAWRVYDAIGAGDDEPSDYAVPWWRMNIFTSLLAARLGDEKLAVRAQDAAGAALPATLPRFRTHLELHRGLMIARSGGLAEGIEHGRTALGALPAAKHSLTLRMLMDEIESTPRA